MKKITSNFLAVAFALVLIAGQGLVLYRDWRNHNPSQNVLDTTKDNVPGINIKNQRPNPNGVAVLMYHHVGDLPQGADKLRRDLTVSSTDFSAELDFLQANGF